MSIGLTDYGIQNDKSDIRGHVSAVNRAVYVYQTKHGVEAIKSGKYPLRPAGQKGIPYVTAEGWLVPWDDIKDIVEVKFPNWDGWEHLREDMTTQQKGHIAASCIVALIDKNLFPLWSSSFEATDVDAQISGTDIIVTVHKKIQSKCDFRAGRKPLGTGNLFLQKSEINPKNLW